MPSLPHLHSAAWLVPVSAPPLAEGAVAVTAGKIVDVGPLELLAHRYPGAALTRYGQAALTPALINAHIHLELSHLEALGKSPHQGEFTDWITRLLALRARFAENDPAMEEAAIRQCRAQYADGVSVLADIGNTDAALALGAIFPGQLLAFHEYLGMGPAALAQQQERLAFAPETRLCCGHAPYSTHPALLSALKKRARRLGHVFPIHTAEPPSELEMLRHGRGPMVDFILSRSRGGIAFQPAVGPAEGSIHYLYRHGLLDGQTLCVHAIHVGEEEIAILAGTGAKVCLCPGSNRFLGVGRAPVQRYLHRGILPALGTDSLASNPELSLWREMRLLAEEEEAPADAVIFAMATLGGAEVLGLETQYGSLEPGKIADILILPLEHPTDDAEELMRMLVRGRHDQPHTTHRMSP